MGILSILAVLSPYIQAGIMLMETLFSEAKSGAIKKSTLERGINTVLDGFGAASGGGQLNTVNAIKPLVPMLIDDAVAAANAAGQLIAKRNVVDVTTGPQKSEA